MQPTIADVEAARERLEGIARVTPVYSSDTISRLVGRPVLLKAENLQRTGAFKIRGAYATLASLTDAERAAGVVTASAGNHGQAVAWAAGQAGLSSTIVVPAYAQLARSTPLAGTRRPCCSTAARSTIASPRHSRSPRRPERR